MGDQVSRIPQSATTPPAFPERRLDSWKEIAAYLGRDVTTVQRWEKREGMPVHRHLHDRMGSVYAFAAELDAWTQTRNLPPGQESDSSAVPASPSAAPAHISVGPTAQRSRALPWIAVAIALAIALALGVALWLRNTEYFWRTPIADARFLKITDFDGIEQAAAVSRDGRFIAFLSNRDGQPDVWITQVGSEQFHNLTHGTVRDLVNPSIRTLGFSPDGSLVTFWARKPGGVSGSDIAIWSVPTLGGAPKPYLEGVAEFDWSQDGSRLAYHTPGPGDPLFVSDGTRRAEDRPIFTAPSGLHAHFPLWSPDKKFIYFVQGALGDKLDIWRIPANGGVPQRMTSHNAVVSHPVFLDRTTLLYLAHDPDGSGPWLYSMDVDRRIPHRLTSGLDPYTSLAAGADGRRLVVTVAKSKRTLWRLPFPSPALSTAAAAPIPLTTSNGFSPRTGPDYLLYVSSSGAKQSIWKLADGTSSELWSTSGARIFGGPAISRDGKSIALSIRYQGKALLYTMRTDGTSVHIVADSLDLQGEPAWSPDGQFIVSAAVDHGIPHLFRIPINGRPPVSITQDHSTDPTWTPDGRLLICSGPDIGTTFSVKAITEDGTSHPLPALTLTRGARHLAFLPGGKQMIFLQGEIEHKNLWVVDLDTGKQRQLTSLAPDFDVRDFDISPDGRELVFERVQGRSDIAGLDLP